VFAEFLLFLLVFPYGHSSVGLTVVFGWSSCHLFVVQCPLCLGPLIFWRRVRADLHVCKERGGASLITHISIVALMFA